MSEGGVIVATRGNETSMIIQTVDIVATAAVVETAIGAALIVTFAQVTPLEVRIVTVADVRVRWAVKRPDGVERHLPVPWTGR